MKKRLGKSNLRGSVALAKLRAARAVMNRTKR